MIYFKEKNVLEVFAEAKNCDLRLKSLASEIVRDYQVSELGYYYRIIGDTLETAENERIMNWDRERRERERGKINSFKVSDEVIDFVVNSGVHSDTLNNKNVKLYGRSEKGKLTLLVAINPDLCDKYSVNKL